MSTEIIVVDVKTPSDSTLTKVADQLRTGGLVVAPTETQYGLMARADEQSIIERLFHVKGRDMNSPTALFVETANNLGKYGRLNLGVRKLAEAFLPGPLTLVLKSLRDWPPPRVVDGRIGLRCSSAPLVSLLLQRVDFPISATSANRSGRGGNQSVQEIAGEFGTDVDLYLDGGQLTGEPSTVVDCVGDQVRVLREGAITTASIENVIGRSDEQRAE